jgi:flagellar secretion chaperone FliS
MHNQARRYQEVAIKTASPVELVVLLYDAALANLQKAQDYLAARDIAGRARCLNKVIEILTELEANLNFEAGGPIASSLERLYRYLKARIFQANLHQDAAPLKECAHLLGNLRGAWAEIAQKEARRNLMENSTPATKAPPVPLAAAQPMGSTLLNLNITA